MLPISSSSWFSITNPCLSPGCGPLFKSPLLDISTFIPLRHLKYNLFKLKLIVTSLKLVPLCFIPCMLLTSPFMKAKNHSVSLQLFLATHSTSQISGSTAFPSKQLSRSKRKPNTTLLCFNRNCSCPDHPRWSPGLDPSVLPASRTALECCAIQENGIRV